MNTFIENLFYKILNMSITASYVILLVIITRFILRKAPKIHSYFLWSVVSFRLIFPFSFASAFSLLHPLNTIRNQIEQMPFKTDTVRLSQDIPLGTENINVSTMGTLPTPNSVLISQVDANPFQGLFKTFSIIWLIGVILMIAYNLYSYVKFKRGMNTAIKIHDRTYESDQISTAFVLGIIKPNIYLPMGLSESERTYIIEHEQVHIKRGDHLIKPLALMVLFMHWFNPLVWMSFTLMNRDMEMSCDEKVVEILGNRIKKEYSQSLLTLNSTHRKSSQIFVLGSPLAFGESNIKRRIKNLLNYKKPSFWVTLFIMILVVLLGVALGTNPAGNFDPVQGGIQNTSDGGIDPMNLEKVYITLDDVKQLSKKGEKLSWADFDAFEGIEVGSGLYIMIYPVEKDYEVWVGGGGLETSPFYIRLTNRKTNATIDIREESVEAFLAEEIQIEDLNATQLIKAEKFEETKYPLLAELPEDDIYLYGQPKGVVIKYGENIQVLDWLYITPRFVLPIMEKADLDKDGVDEIICILNMGSGTGVSVDELHVLKLEKSGKYVDYIYDNYLEQAKALIHYNYVKGANLIQIDMGDSTYDYSIVLENQSLTFKDINYLNIVSFNFSKDLSIHLPLGISFDEYASPIYTEGIEFEGEIEFKNGTFNIKSMKVINKLKGEQE